MTNAESKQNPMPVAPVETATVSNPLNAGILSYNTPESVCGEDDRKEVTNTTALPYQWICRLSMEFAQGTFVGSGWLAITGSKKNLVIVTSGHCVFSRADSTFARKMVVTPGANGEQAPWGSWTVGPEALRASDGWKTRGDPPSDYGVILVPYQGFPWGVSMWQATDSELQGINILNAGYPGDKRPYGFNWEDSGALSDLDPQMLHYMNDTAGGESGSPVLVGQGSEWHSIGIHGYGGCPNKAVRLTEKVTADIVTWSQS